MGGEITNYHAVVYMPKRRRPEECDADEAWSPWMFAFYRRSRRNLQLLWIKQQKTGEASFFSAAVIADNNDPLLAIDYGGAYSFSVLQALQARNGD